MAIDWNIIDDAPPPAPAALPDALDARRVHVIVLERRATHRARLRAVLVLIACAAVAAMAVMQAWSMRASHPTRAAICAAIATGAVWIGVRAARHRPARPATLTAASSTPDFDALPATRSAAERLAEMDR